MSAKAVLHWSGGKDAALAYWLAKQEGGLEITALLTTTIGQRGVSSVHEIPQDVLQAQADAMGLELITVPLPGDGMLGYEDAIAAQADALKARGIGAFIFGDLRASGMLDYRRQQWSNYGFNVIAPLWGLGDSSAMMRQSLAAGIQSLVVVVMADKLPVSVLGKTVDEPFLRDLPPEVDPAGEMGEYHTLVVNAPFFSAPIPVMLGEPLESWQDIRLSDGSLRRFTYWKLPVRHLPVVIAE